MNVKVKICGMRDPENIVDVAALQPDYMGFIFYDKSPRYAGEELSIPPLPDSIKKVGVFVNEKPEIILKKVARYQLDFVQLHGDEPADELKELNVHVKVIKAFSVDDRFDFREVKPYEPVATYFLFDTKGKFYGGNARSFDWKMLRKYDQSVPFFLSGGISPENVLGVKDFGDLNIHALDVNSGVETAPGLKDVNKIMGLKRAISSLPK